MHLAIRLLACTAVIVGCSDPTGVVPVNPKLTRVWGDIVSVEHPVWVSQNKLYVYSGLINGPEVISGIFEITVDPSNLSLVALKPYSFGDRSSRHISNIVYDALRQQALVIYRDSNGFHLVEVTLANDQVIIEEELVGSAWQPQGATPWPGNPGVLYYGASPGDGTHGFYWHRSNQADSLLLPVTLARDEARGIAVSSDGRYLFFASSTRGTVPIVVKFYRLDLLESGALPVELAERIGVRGAVIPHPSDPDILLLNYFFPGDPTMPPQSHIELVDTSTGERLDLNVRTVPYMGQFTVNDHPWWSPDGRHFAFSAGSFEGEGGVSALELWIYRDVR